MEKRTDTAALVDGAELGPYRVLRLIGRGGMAEVYAAEHRSLGRMCAIKVLTAEDADGTLRKRFCSEARALCRIEHPGVMRVYDLGETEGARLPWYSMDLHVDAAGAPSTLEAAMKGGGVTEETVAGWYEDVRDALEAVHAAGVFHRDIKPANILLNGSGRAVLSDFGIAKFGGPMKAEVAAESTLVAFGECCVPGTPKYLPPEALQGGEPTAAWDFWMLGVTFFRLLTGVDFLPGMVASEFLTPFDRRWRSVLEGLVATRCEDRVMRSFARRPKPCARFSFRRAAVLAAGLLLVAVVAGWGWKIYSRCKAEQDRQAFVDSLARLPDYLKS